MNIIHLGHRRFISFWYKNKQFLIKNNSTEKIVYKRCDGLNITPQHMFLFSIILCIEYKPEFINLHDFLIYQYHFNSKIVINNLIHHLRLLHEKQVAWMDMKPENILINPDTCQILFVDFNYSFTGIKSQKIGVTFPYVAPENAYGNIGKDLFLLQKNDVFVLGMIILFILGHNRNLILYGKYLDKHYKDFIKNIKIYEKIIDDFFMEKKHFLDLDPFVRHL
jgi:serine/threonine protein kinase